MTLRWHVFLFVYITGFVSICKFNIVSTFSENCSHFFYWNCNLNDKFVKLITFIIRLFLKNGIQVEVIPLQYVFSIKDGLLIAIKVHSSYFMVKKDYFSFLTKISFIIIGGFQSKLSYYNVIIYRMILVTFETVNTYSFYTQTKSFTRKRYQQWYSLFQ